MKMQTWCANSQRDITDYINEHGIKKEMIVNIYQTREGEYILNYYSED